MSSLKLLIWLCLLIPSVSFSQTIKFGTTEIEFGKSISEYKELWGEGGQIESDDENIEIYESENILGSFYKNKLVSLTIIANNNEALPSNYDVEEILKLYKPYKIEEGVVDGTDIAEQRDYYKTEEFYIEKIAVRMETQYTITPLKYGKIMKKKI